MRIFHLDGTRYLAYNEKSKQSRVVDRPDVVREIALLEEIIAELDGIAGDDKKLLVWAKDMYEDVVMLPRERALLQEKQDLRDALDAVVVGGGL